MIDIEVKVFNQVYPHAAPLCAKNKFVSTLSKSLSALPCGVLYELDNRTVQKRQTSTPQENFALVTFQAEFYAKTKQECRALFAAVDEQMILMNFTRVSGQYLPYPDNTGVERYVARYEAEADRDGNLYRRG